MAKMVVYDVLDEQLVRLLETDVRQSSRSLAGQLQVSAATVRRRIRNLVRSNVLRTVAVVDPGKLGFSLIAVIAMDVAHDKVDSVVQMLVSRPEITWVSTTTGRFDILTLAKFRSTEELSHFVQKELSRIEGLQNTETSICLEIGKGRYMQV